LVTVALIFSINQSIGMLNRCQCFHNLDVFWWCCYK
jgi:hypothetical protein